MTRRSYVLKEAHRILSPVGFWMPQTGEHVILRYSTRVKAVIYELDPHTSPLFLKDGDCVPTHVEDSLPNVKPNVFLEDPNSQRKASFLLDGQKRFEILPVTLLIDWIFFEVRDEFISVKTDG